MNLLCLCQNIICVIGKIVKTRGNIGPFLNFNISAIYDHLQWSLWLNNLWGELNFTPLILINTYRAASKQPDFKASVVSFHFQLRSDLDCRLENAVNINIKLWFQFIPSSRMINYLAWKFEIEYAKWYRTARSSDYGFYTQRGLKYLFIQPDYQCAYSVLYAFKPQS